MSTHHPRPRASRALRSPHTPMLRVAAPALAALALVAACASEPTTTGGAATRPGVSATVVNGKPLGRDVQKDLATLKAATAQFHRIEVAKDAKYTDVFMNMCMVDDGPTPKGGMGYHYVNSGLVDGKVDVATPEALLYEPQRNGQLRLVGVEYVIPKGMWTGTTEPVLFGRTMKLNKFDLYALHVWAWEDNPDPVDGIFADWNPRVTCDAATATGAHH